MKKNVLMLRIAGAINLLFLVFHAMFYKLFDWHNTLSGLSPVNRSIFFTYHAIIILVLGFMSIVSLFQAKMLLDSILKYCILSMFSLFFMIRIVAEFALFAEARPPSVIILVMCGLPTICYLLPMFYKPNS